jgi:tRNA(Arg) A34 adenosine deaminase TadA
MVVPGKCSILHAEIVAVAFAQKILGRYDIGDSGKFSYNLVTSAEPCAMCLGAVPWSGVNRLICGARDQDARNVGFDEGSKLPNWAAELESRGIVVLKDVLRNEAATVLREYASNGGLIYNSGNQ